MTAAFMVVWSVVNLAAFILFSQRLDDLRDALRQARQDWSANGWAQPPQPPTYGQLVYDDTLGADYSVTSGTFTMQGIGGRLTPLAQLNDWPPPIPGTRAG